MKTIGAIFLDRMQADVAVNHLRTNGFRDVWLGVAVYVEERTSFGDFNWLCFEGEGELVYAVLRAKGLDQAQIDAFAADLTEGSVVVTVPAKGKAAKAIAIFRDAGGDVRG